MPSCLHGDAALYSGAMESSEHTPRVSVIIPSWDGHRNGCVPRLLASVRAQSFQDFETHIVKGISPQGKAINNGAKQARGSLLIILDDDSELADTTVFETLVRVVDEDATVGMAGASIVTPPDSTPFQQRAATQFPRFNTPVVDRVVDSDLACHGCCAIPRAVFDAVGGEREDIMRGLDPDLRERLRAAGYRVVLAPNARIYHPLPESWRKLSRQFFRNGYGSAYAQKFQPDSVYETHESLDAASFVARRPLWYRALRFPLRLLKAAVEGKSMRLAAYCAYGAGYLWGMLSAKRGKFAT